MSFELAGYFGVMKTLELISREYWWPQPWKFVKEYSKTCDVCACFKMGHHRPFGLLQPCPHRPWASLSIEFIPDLPLIGGNDLILIFVDQFTKLAQFAPCSKAILGEDLVDIFLKHVIRLHGLPDDISFDQGPQFISHLWKWLLQTFNIFANLLMDKLSGSTRSWNNTFGVHSTINKIIGSTCFQW